MAINKDEIKKNLLGFKERLVEKVNTFAHLTKEETHLELHNRSLARRLASEAIVLLTNDGTLPLSTKEPVALYGIGVTNTIKGGSGSGEVNERHCVTIYEGMKLAGFQIANEKMLKKYASDARKYRRNYEINRIKQAGIMNLNAIGMANIEKSFREREFYLIKEKDFIPARVCIYVISRMSGEGCDRTRDKGDYALSEVECQNLRFCAAHHEKVILVFNAGGAIDISEVEDLSFAAILQMGMLGEEGGNAFADIISGEENPSAHLTASWPKRYADIPYGEDYAGVGKSVDEGDYKEGIFVGYRYYERFDVAPRFLFGQGLSYTSFEQKGIASFTRGCRVRVQVKNTGKVPGKSVAFLFLSKPEGCLVQPSCELIAYKKTRKLAPSEKEELYFEIPYTYFASYDEAKGAEVMEKGQYVLYLGESLACKQPIGAFRLTEDVILAHRAHICARREAFPILQPSHAKALEELPRGFVSKLNGKEILDSLAHRKSEKKKNNLKRYEKKAKCFVKHLTYKGLSYLLVGDGVMDLVMPRAHHLTVPGAAGYTTNRYEKYGIPSASFCDGPAGLRLMRTAVVKKGANKIRIVEPALEMFRFLPALVRMLGGGKEEDGTPIYTYATAFPTGTALAQTFNEALLEKMGDAVGYEMDEYGVNVWLAPGMNIQRNPLCGRNYEYYSEDPVVSGKTAAAIVRGVQRHPGRYATIKHFACNNQEDRRQHTSANLDERTLRDLYLRGFGIAVREAGCLALMTSYNRVNGVWSAVNKDLLTTYLRDECGFDGFVVTDWDGSHKGLEAERAIEAGIHLLMEGRESQRRAIYRALRSGRLDVKLARQRAVKVVAMILSAHDDRED